MVVGSAEVSMPQHRLSELRERREPRRPAPSAVDRQPTIVRSTPARGRRRWAAVAVAAIASLVLSGLGPSLRGATVSADGVPGLPDLTFYGRGYGHGVGMSQYGARGRALAGQLAPDILAHYYPTTTIGSRSTSTAIRVLLLSGFAATAAKPLTVVGARGAWTVDGIATAFPANAWLSVAPTAAGATTWTLRVVSSTGALLATRVVTGNLYVRPAERTTLLQVPTKSATNLYRGFLRIRLTATATVVDHVSLELYLRGVVPLEMPASWPAEALRAQAIAARSYAYARLHPTTGLYDVYDDTRSQVYRGRKVETTATNLAVIGTAGSVLLSGTTVANALFHSADGGWTENNENVFVSSGGTIVAGPLAYLRGSSDRAPDGSSYDKASPYATWQTATYSAAALSAILATDPRTNVGTLTTIDLSRRGVSGRLISVTLGGDLGSKTVSGEVFRAVFNAGRPSTDPMMRSTLLDVAPIP
jgi:SpoIID/LytB domain protein